MRSSLSTLGLSTILTTLITTATAAPEPRVLAATYQKFNARDVAAPQGLRRRASAVNAVIENAQGDLLYLLNVTVGTPGQNLGLQLDTGSSDIWLPASSSRVCSRSKRCTDGSFDSSKSSTFETLSQGTFQISYVDTTTITGDYISDVFSVSGATLKNMTMGLAESSTTPDNTGTFDGIVGVGFASGESYAAQTGQTYPNFLTELVQQGVIATQAYSLWLNDISSTTGNILFGGIDTAKYHGNLAILPIIPDSQSGTISSFTVTLDNFAVVGAGNATQYSQSNLAAAVVLDSGTTLTYLPDAIANAVANGVGAVNSRAYGLVVPCSLASTSAYLTFGFGNPNGPVITVPISEFVVPFPPGVTPPTFSGTNARGCQWGLLAAGQSPLLLGDTFLRSAYVVYNLAGSQIGIAQASYNATTSNIVQISQASSIPNAATTVSEVAAQQTATNIGNSGLQTTDYGSAASATNTVVGAGSTGTFNLGSATATPTGTGSPSGASSTPKAAATHNTSSGGSALAALIALAAAFF